MRSVVTSLVHACCHSRRQCMLISSRCITTPQAFEQPPRRSATAVAKGNPLEKMDLLFRSNPSALRLHRELTIAIAKGLSEEASDLAATLAAMVARHSSVEPPAAESSPSPSKHDLPPVTEDSIDATIGKVAEHLKEVVQQHNNTDHDTESDSTTSALEAKFWKSSSSLTCTIVESNFELVDEADAGSSSTDEQLLEKYLSEETERWRMQKHAIAKIVLDTAKAYGLTPERIHVADDTLGNGTQRLNPMKHANLVVRGELYDAENIRVGHSTKGWLASDAELRAACEVEWKELEATGHISGKHPMTASERAIAVSELMLLRSRLRFSVGLKKDLGDQLDITAPETKEGAPSPSDEFQATLVRALNPVASNGVGELREEERLAVVPVLPFTFMLKLCLWYEPKIPDSESP